MRGVVTTPACCINRRDVADGIDPNEYLVEVPRRPLEIGWLRCGLLAVCALAGHEEIFLSARAAIKLINRDVCGVSIALPQQQRWSRRSHLADGRCVHLGCS